MWIISRKILAIMTCSAALLPASAAAQNYSDSWWNPAESGWGLTITDHGTDMFVHWFTFDQNGRNQRYVMSGGTFSNGKCQFNGILQRMTGPSWYARSFDPGQVVRTTAGSAALDFCAPGLEPGTLKFDYSADGVTGSKHLVRMSFGNDAPHWGALASTGGPDFTDLWWNPDESGWGVTITQRGNNAFARIYAFDDQGMPLLLSVSGVTFWNSHSFSGAAQTTSGPWFGSAQFDPGRVLRTTVGSVEFKFTDPNNGVLTFDSNGKVISKLITRLRFGEFPASALACRQAQSAITPSIGSQAAWDAAYDGAYGATLPDLNGGTQAYALQGHYWVRAYVSMAKTFGDPKYLDRAANMIMHWFNTMDSPQGWGAALGPAQMMLDTGIIAQAVMIYAYEMWNDSRFLAYRPSADRFIAQLEPVLRSYDKQWVDVSPYPGAPGFYVYNTCGGLCGAASLVMYNQGATMAKALLLLDRVYRLKSQVPDAGYRQKADASAAYFKTFVRQNGNAYLWDYGGARPNTGVEDISHAHLDLSLIVWARAFGLGGLTETDMQNLAGTMHGIFLGDGPAIDVAMHVDGTSKAYNNWFRVPVGYDWIDLSDVDPVLYDKTVQVFNAHIPVPTSARFFLGWAEILRKRACVWL
jgi:hypothetical protein